MNAADVLAEAAGRGLRFPDDDADWLVAALLAHGEQGQGVYIDPEGEMWTLEWRAHEGEDGEIAEATGLTVGDITTGAVANPYWTTLYRLVPLSAEAGDTDAEFVHGEVARLQAEKAIAESGVLVPLSAEAGDTDDRSWDGLTDAEAAADEATWD